MLKIKMKNESQKYYVSLNRRDYTSYPEEQEILLQAGLTAKNVCSYEDIQEGESLTVFELFISEAMV